MKILSLDISSSTIGWATMSKVGDKIILNNYGHIKPMSKKKSDDNLSLRLKDILTRMEELFKNENPDEIVIEDYLKRFSKGRSSANTIILLAVFNEIITMAGYSFTGKKPSRYSVTSLRALVNKKYGKKIKDKDDVINFVASEFSNYKTTLNRAGNIKTECEDEADSIILGLSHLLT